MGSIGKNYLKRITMPRVWPFNRKGTKYIVRPNPGAHDFEFGIPLCLALRDLLGYAKTFREVKQMLHKNQVLVDGRIKKDPKYDVGFMDVISIPALKKHFRVLFDKRGKISLVEIDEKESKIKLCKITGISSIKGGKLQLNFHDSRNIIIDKKEYSVGDTAVVELPENKIKESFKLEKGSSIMLIRGKHIGERGSLEGIEGQTISYKSEGKLKETVKKYAFVLGKSNSAIKIE